MCFKRTVGMAIGAIAMLAVAGPALAQPANDEVFKVTTAIKAGTNPLVSFDISWFDPKLKRYFLADRSNNQIDVISGITPQTPIGHNCFAGLVMNTTAISGPDGVLTVHRGEDEDEGAVTELWVGDS